MDKEQVLLQVSNLRKKLAKAQKDYYVVGKSEISDAEYDSLFDTLVDLEKRYPQVYSPTSPTLRVGSDLTSDFEEVEHTISVLSLDKAYKVEELVNFTNKYKDSNFVMEQKIDGVSIVLYYENGILVRAVTRGNGTIGNDVTQNVRTMQSVPLELPEPIDVAVRGEIYIAKDDFDKLNENNEYANARNLCAGSIRRIKSSEVAKIPLKIFCYEGFFAQEEKSHVDILKRLKELGFVTNDYTYYFAPTLKEAESKVKGTNIKALSNSEIAEYVTKMNTLRDSLPYEIDGLVLKLDDIALRNKLGNTAHHPRWAIAYKFESVQAETTVLDIALQVGRTGRITPVAKVKPTLLMGSTISNITLHNQDYINMLELSIGDKVAISKRGDVIPAVEYVIDKNEEGNTTYKLSTHCPSCDSVLKEIGAHTFCTNSECPSQVLGRLQYFVGRKQMDMVTLGDETIDYLVKNYNFKNVIDLYTFDYTRLLENKGFKDRKVKAILKSIEESKLKPWPLVLVSLGIEDFGLKTINLLVEDGITNLEELQDIVESNNKERLLSIKGLGSKTVDSLFASIERLNPTIVELRKVGFKFKSEEAEEKTTEFENQTWCITGSLNNFSARELAAKEIISRGGKVTSSVSKSTTHLLAGEKAGSKLKKAQSYGTTIVSEDEFMKLINKNKEEGERQLSLF